MQNRIPRVSVETLGCKVNQYESEAIAEALTARGCKIVAFDEEADAAIINTCTVTAESDRKSCQMIRRAAGRKNRPFVVVTGCLAQAQPERAAAIPGVCYVCGSRNKMSAADVVMRYLETGERPDTAQLSVPDVSTSPYEKMNICRSERTRAYIKVEDGCDNHCTFCAIRGARGSVCSRRPEDVTAEMRTLTDNGYREIVLTGIEIASYGTDLSKDGNRYRLIDLLEEADRVPGLGRLRLGSLEPTVMREENVQRLAALSHIAPHFHLSLQSGSDHVLRLMKRKYNMDYVRTMMENIRKNIPDVMFTADIMTGFPQETEEDFAQTLAFVREARFLHVHVFPYSRRKNTPADEMPGQLPNEEKNRRANILIAEDKRIAAELYRERAQQGGNVIFLAETLREDGTLVGHAANFMEVHLPHANEALAGHKELRSVAVCGAGESFLLAEEL